MLPDTADVMFAGLIEEIDECLHLYPKYHPIVEDPFEVEPLTGAVTRIPDGDTRTPPSLWQYETSRKELYGRSSG